MLNLNTDRYDCVISNLALQWAPDLQYAINFLNSKSTTVFAFSTLLEGTFAEWQHVINRYQSTQILVYPKSTELIPLVHKLKKQEQDFQCWLVDYSLSFDSPVSFMRYLQSLGASASSKLVHISNLKKLLKAHIPGLAVTYKVFFGILRRIS